MGTGKRRDIHDMVTFNQDIAPVLQAICAPLYEHLKLNAFGYSRLYRDGRRVIIESNLNWLAKYSENGFLEEPTHDKSLLNSLHVVQHKNYQSVVLAGEPQSQLHEMLHALDMWNSISIYSKSLDYFEVFHFATSKDNTSILSTYVNYYDLLKRFCLYFNDQFLSSHWPLPTVQMAHSDYVKQLFESSQNVDLEAFMAKTTPTKWYIATKNQYVSQREAACWHHLCLGKTTKQIASLLDLSPRTVEQHLCNIKLKFGVHFKSELIQIGLDNSLESMAV